MAFNIDLNKLKERFSMKIPFETHIVYVTLDNKVYELKKDFSIVEGKMKCPSVENSMVI